MDPIFSAHMKRLSAENINHIFGFIYSPQPHVLTQEIRDVPLKMEKFQTIINKIVNRITFMEQQNVNAGGMWGMFQLGNDYINSLAHMTFYHYLREYKFYTGFCNSLNLKRDLKKVWLNFSIQKISLIIECFDVLINDIANN